MTDFRKLYFAIFLSLIMALLLPLSSYMATCTQTYTHFVFFFGHANVLHLLLNVYCLFMLHHLFSPTRFLGACTVSVLLSFIPLVVPHPTLGFSSVLFFFMGLYFPVMWHRDRLASFQLMLFMAVTFFLPNIAALLHLLTFLAGLTWIFFERLWHDFRSFSNSD